MLERPTSRTAANASSRQANGIMEQTHTNYSERVRTWHIPAACACAHCPQRAFSDIDHNALTNLVSSPCYLCAVSVEVAAPVLVQERLIFRACCGLKGNIHRFPERLPAGGNVRVKKRKKEGQACAYSRWAHRAQQPSVHGKWAFACDTGVGVCDSWAISAASPVQPLTLLLQPSHGGYISNVVFICQSWPQFCCDLLSDHFGSRLQ